MYVSKQEINVFNNHDWTIMFLRLYFNYLRLNFLSTAEDEIQ